MPRFRSAVARRDAVRRGIDAETRVANALLVAGWSIRARNWMGAGAEIDIVAIRDQSIRFVEVKQRSGSEQLGLESVDTRKQRRLIRGAEAWMAQSLQDATDIAFLVAVVGTQGITWVDDAFDLSGSR